LIRIAEGSTFQLEIEIEIEIGYPTSKENFLRFPWRISG